MEWTRSETLALAANSCTQCHGLGLRIGRRGTASPCNCVLRGIFRACYARFRNCVEKEKHLSKCVLEFMPGSNHRNTWGRKDEEYCADFILIARRVLTPEEYRIFNFHFMLGADWRLCCIRLKLDRGLFFHAIYRIQQVLGKTFLELEPYALYPLDEYFNGGARGNDPITMKTAANVLPFPKPGGGGMKVPLRKVA